jgi:hypothetical protein
LLWGHGLFYRLVTLGAAIVAGLGAVGLTAPRSRLGRSRLATLPAFFLLVNVASVAAAWNLVTGRRIDRWVPRRDALEPNAITPASDAPSMGVDVPADDRRTADAVGSGGRR